MKWCKPDDVWNARRLAVRELLLGLLAVLGFVLILGVVGAYLR